MMITITMVDDDQDEDDGDVGDKNGPMKNASKFGHVCTE